MNDCIFCKIVQKDLPAEVVYEDEKFMIFPDIHPVSPVHLLIVTKKHIQSVDHLQSEDKELMGELMIICQKVARMKNLKGYKLQINVGREGGQIVDHLHIHLLAN